MMNRKSDRLLQPSEQSFRQYQRNCSCFSSFCCCLCWGFFWGGISSLFFAVCGAIAGAFDKHNIIKGFHIPDHISTFSFADIAPVWRGTLYGAASGFLVGMLLFITVLACKACYRKHQSQNEHDFAYHLREEDKPKISYVRGQISQTFA